MPETATLQVQGRTYNLPVVVGTENEVAVDISKLRAESGVITLDDGYSNTGSCKSAITFIDGEQGILRYRGIPIEQIAEHSTFAETAWLLIYGELPTAESAAVLEQPPDQARDAPRGALQALRRVPGAGPPDGHPLGDGERGELLQPRRHQDGEPGDVPGRGGAPAVSKTRTIAAAAYKTSIGQPLDLPEAAPRLLLELPAHDVLDPVQGLRAGSGRRRRAAAHPGAPRRPRAELLDEHGPDGGVERREPVRQLRGRRLRAVGPAARRRERRGASRCCSTSTTAASR